MADLYEKALQDFDKVRHLTYFEPSEHVSVADLCYLCLHELDLHAEGEYWHPAPVRRDLLNFCKKWGPLADEKGMDYSSEAQRQYDIGKGKKKADCISIY